MPEVLIQLQNIALTRGEQRILENISWTIRQGENWAVLGGNGAGKSTLLKIVRGDLWPDHHAGNRTYFFEGEATFSPFRSKEKIALISFEHQAKYWRQEWPLSGRELLHTGFFGSELLHQTPTPEQTEQAEDLASHLGLSGLLESSIQQISQGELRRLLIARALLSKPEILILDEFCAGLDAFSRGAMLDFLATLASSGTQLICSTHRREEIIPCLQNVLQLQNGKVWSTVFQWEGGKAGSREGNEKGNIAHSNSKAIGRLASKQLPSSLSVFPPSRLPVENGRDQFLLCVRNANVILDEKIILHDFNWEMLPGQHWAVIGANGSGKSTFLKMLTGDLWPARGGHVHRFGRTTFEGLWKLKEKINLLSHESQAKYHEAVSAREAVASGFFHSVGLGLIERISDEQKAHVDYLLDWLQISHLSERPFQGLSTGEGRKVLLARALVHRPQILLLDEPFDGLDEAARDFITARFEELAQAGTHFIFVSHHEADFPDFLTHEMHLANGRIVKIHRRDTETQREI
ncbi:MAG TPA: ATP-binding cassette domain-containing protein [Abditibacteriaceae bacterium]